MIKKIFVRDKKAILFWCSWSCFFGRRMFLWVLDNNPDLSLNKAQTIAKGPKITKKKGNLSGKEEGRVKESGDAFMSLQLSLSQICWLWLLTKLWIGPIGRICSHKREAFGLGLSQGQSSMFQLSSLPWEAGPAKAWNEQKVGWKRGALRGATP